MGKLEELLDLYNFLEDRKKNSISSNFLARKNAILSQNKSSLVKLAFDTRRINQEIDYNPRRNLQSYLRSEGFISEATTKKVKLLSKLLKSVEELYNIYGTSDEWQDSYCRILRNLLQNCLLKNSENNDEFSDNQKSTASLEYLEDLLYTRYRLQFNDLEILSNDKLKAIILDKDHELKKKDIRDLIEPAVKISRKEVQNQSYDMLIEKLFGGLEGDTERTVTITIKNKSIKED